MKDVAFAVLYGLLLFYMALFIDKDVLMVSSVLLCGIVFVVIVKTIRKLGGVEK